MPLVGLNGHVCNFIYVATRRTIVIDVGKNFQAAALEWFPKYGLRDIDAVLITHAHADGVSTFDSIQALYPLTRMYSDKQ